MNIICKPLQENTLKTLSVVFGGSGFVFSVVHWTESNYVMFVLPFWIKSVVFRGY